MADADTRQGRLFYPYAHSFTLTRVAGSIRIATMSR